jgi:hypothetical protein
MCHIRSLILTQSQVLCKERGHKWFLTGTHYTYKVIFPVLPQQALSPLGRTWSEYHLQCPHI